jgi:hypothetical protein
MEDNASAQIVVTDLLGKELQVIGVSDAKGFVMLDASSLADGMYYYSLRINGANIHTHRMVVRR